MLDLPSARTVRWTDCIGLRGFIGWALDEADPALREILLPLFHRGHETPAPFRLFYAGASGKAGWHCFKLIGFGPDSPRLHAWLAQLLVGRKGTLRRGQQQLPFQLLDYQTEAAFVAHFPGCQTGNILGDTASSFFPKLDSAVFRLSSAAPSFFKRNGTQQFAEGTWTQLLALRFADLAGVPRQSLQDRTPTIPIEGRCKLKVTPISFGSRQRARRGIKFRSEPFSLDQEAFEWLQLLIRIGIGAHTAYGAGHFNLEIADSRLRMP